jgi:hypothetical protein
MIRTNATLTSRKQPISRDVGRAIVAKCRPGKWHPLSEIAAATGASERDVNSVLETMCWRSSYGAKAEWKKVGKERHYRIFMQQKSVSVDELTEKLTPIIKGLDAEGRKTAVTTIPAEVRMLAAKLKKLLDEWAE